MTWGNWLAAATEVTPPEQQAPTIPSELIGSVIIALITGVVAVVVAIIQRGKAEKTSPSPAVSFAVPEVEWYATRNRSIATEADHKTLAKAFDGHVTDYDEHVDKSNEALGKLREDTSDALSKIREDLANIKGQLGIR